MKGIKRYKIPVIKINKSQGCNAQDSESLCCAPETNIMFYVNSTAQLDSQLEKVQRCDLKEGSR